MFTLNPTLLITMLIILSIFASIPSVWSFSWFYIQCLYWIKVTRQGHHHATCLITICFPVLYILSSIYASKMINGLGFSGLRSWVGFLGGNSVELIEFGPPGLITVWIPVSAQIKIKFASSVSTMYYNMYVCPGSLLPVKRQASMLSLGHHNNILRLLC